MSDSTVSSFQLFASDPKQNPFRPCAESDRLLEVLIALFKRVEAGQNITEYVLRDNSEESGPVDIGFADFAKTISVTQLMELFTPPQPGDEASEDCHLRAVA